MKSTTHRIIYGGFLPSWFLCSLLLTTVPQVSAQGTLADYERARSLQDRFQGLALNVPGPAHWIAGTGSLWYSKSVRGGQEFVLVDAETLVRKPAFDHEKLAAALSRASGTKYSALKLPFADERPFGRFGGSRREALRFADRMRSVEFAAAGFMWKCNLETYECAKGEAVPQGPNVFGRRTPENSSPEYEEDSPASPQEMDSDVRDGVEWLTPQQDRAPSGRGGQAQEEAKTSPDEKWEALIQNYNVFLRRKNQSETLPLSYDGSEDNYYTLRSIAWSPDSTRLVAYRTRPGFKREVHYVQSSPADQIQPKHSTLVYPKPGDTLDAAQPVLFEIDSKKAIPIDDSLFPNPYSITPSVWRKDGKGFTFEYNQRGHQIYRVIEVDAGSGAAREVITEESRTFIDYRPLAESRTDTGKKFRHDLADGKEIIWASERDGWEHLYLYDGTTGKLKNQITRGNWVVRFVDLVDEKKRQIWFRASGMIPGQDPYFTHYYRINFDGSGLTAYTEADGDHSVAFSTDRKYYVDTWSRVDQAAVSQMRRTEDRKVLMDIERGDVSPLVAAGWKAPEVFVARGRDGTTDIWGVIYRPTSFDPTKRYPVIESIYAGPQGSFVPKTFAGTANSLAELGFIVVQIDGMGTNNRSKAFHDVCWKNLGDAGFPDRLLWHRAVAAKYPWYDITRVGLYGNSAGGQSSLGGMLFHPEFYRVCVSSCGCHDNRMDKIWWNEQWMGWPLGPHYAASSNVENAYRLKGRLLLIVGEMDNNVDPSSTLQVVNALIKASKVFDLLVIPNGGHGMGGAYGERKRDDFFVHHLLGVEPPEWSLDIKP